MLIILLCLFIIFYVVSKLADSSYEKWLEEYDRTSIYNINTGQLKPGKQFYCDRYPLRKK